jgi:protein TonB
VLHAGLVAWLVFYLHQKPVPMPPLYQVKIFAAPPGERAIGTVQSEPTPPAPPKSEAAPTTKAPSLPKPKSATPPTTKPKPVPKPKTKSAPAQSTPLGPPATKEARSSSTPARAEGGAI